MASHEAGWAGLAAELDGWGEAGRIATLWWRDDDAVAPTPELDRLLDLAAGLPLALAVIPAPATEALAGRLAAYPGAVVLQHGWTHRNHAVQGKKSEYPEGRPMPEVAGELAAGRARLYALFGDRALPVFVPPWNRFAADFLPLLDPAGLAGFSAMAASRPAPPLPRAVRRLDVHVDPVAWHGDRGFVGEAAALDMLVGQLQARRTGKLPPSEPIGILTHHLAIDSPLASFMKELVAVVERHGAVKWGAVAELLGLNHGHDDHADKRAE